MRKPNFFIIGAPKCGTTSIAAFLENHPQIFMSHPKEINFFNTDLKIGDVNSLDQYLSIFKKASKEHLAIGEASTFYLYSEVAVDKILEFNPNAKFIVMLRNPIEMVTSFHAEMCWSGLESIDDFEKAFYTRNKGLDDLNVGYACRDISLLKYESVCKLGFQVDRLLNKVKRENVHFAILDDFSIDPKAECKKILEFLGVIWDVDFDLHKLNLNRKYKSAFLRKLMWLIGRTRKHIKLPRITTKIINLIHEMNSTPIHHRDISDELKLQLIMTYQGDIAMLSIILGRDFSDWLAA
jgi:hypothetical protein